MLKEAYGDYNILCEYVLLVLPVFLKEKIALSEIESEDNVDRFFFYTKVIVHQEFVLQGLTVNGEFYPNMLDSLCKSMLG